MAIIPPPPLPTSAAPRPHTPPPMARAPLPMLAPPPRPLSISDAMVEDLRNALKVAGSASLIEAQFVDGSALRFRAGNGGTEVQTIGADSRAAHYGERLAGVGHDGDAVECRFTDGSSIRILPFG